MSEETTAQPAKTPAAEARSGMAARFSAAGMPAEKSRDFRGSARRLGSQLRPERGRVVTVLVLAVARLRRLHTRPGVGRVLNGAGAGLFAWLAARMVNT